MCVCVWTPKKQKANTPMQSAVKNVFIRGSVVRYVHLPANAVDVPLLEDATRRGTAPPSFVPFCSRWQPPLRLRAVLFVRLWKNRRGVCLRVTIFANGPLEAANQATKAK